MPEDSSPLAKANALLVDAQTSASKIKLGFEKNARWRTFLAYGLKAIALFGGLFVATVKQIDPTIPGVIIAAAVLLDQLMSNYRRMLSYTVAASAIDRTQQRVGNKYNDQLIPIEVLIDRGGKAKIQAEAQRVDLVANTAKALRDELERIQTAVQKQNIEYLSSLNLEHPTQTTIPELPHN